MATSDQDVVCITGLIADHGADPIVVGGWGIDALAGSQTRTHRDLDVLVQDEFVPAITASLLKAGFEVATDWLPVRVELSQIARNRHVDIHPIFDDGRGGWWQHGLDGAKFDYLAHVLTSGRIATTRVRCLTADKQRSLHFGYEMRRQDIHDLNVLDSLTCAEP